MAQAPKVSKRKVSQDIDLEELFGVSFKGARALREAIGQAIIDKMLDRTRQGLGMRFKGDVGREIKLKGPYSDEYINSDEFKAFGKKKSPINMKLTGDMLGSIDISNQTSSSVQIAIDDDVEAKKAYAHIKGKESGEKGINMPSRPFFGVNTKELNEIKREFKGDVKQALKAKQSEGKKAFESAVLSLIDKISKDSEA